MSVQYKSSDGWKNISSSSNNAVDTVENGNMNPVTSNAVYDKLNSFITITTEFINSNEFVQDPNYPQRYDITLAPTVTPSGYTKCIAAVLGVAWFSSNVYVPLEVYDRIKYVYNDQFQFAVCTPDMTNIQNTAFKVSYIWTK